MKKYKRGGGSVAKLGGSASSLHVSHHNYKQETTAVYQPSRSTTGNPVPYILINYSSLSRIQFRSGSSQLGMRVITHGGSAAEAAIKGLLATAKRQREREDPTSARKFH